MLTDPERAALAALLSEALPSTSGPGALEAGAPAYVESRLGGREAHRLAGLRALLARRPRLGDLAAAGDPWFEVLRAWAWEGYLRDPEGPGCARFGAEPRRKAGG